MTTDPHGSRKWKRIAIAAVVLLLSLGGVTIGKVWIGADPAEGSMTPEQFVIILGAVTALIGVLGGIAVQLYALSKKADTAKDRADVADQTSARIEANTNGALSAANAVRKDLEESISSLEESLRQAIAEGVEDRRTARQAATDVRAAFTSGEKGRAETTEPGPPEEGS